MNTDAIGWLRINPLSSNLHLAPDTGFSPISNIQRAIPSFSFASIGANAQSDTRKEGNEEHGLGDSRGKRQAWQAGAASPFSIGQLGNAKIGSNT